MIKTLHKIMIFYFLFLQKHLYIITDMYISRLAVPHITNKCAALNLLKDDRTKHEGMIFDVLFNNLYNF